jgi:hypothetical protein
LNSWSPSPSAFRLIKPPNSLPVVPSSRFIAVWNWRIKNLRKKIETNVAWEWWHLCSLRNSHSNAFKCVGFITESDYQCSLIRAISLVVIFVAVVERGVRTRATTYIIGKRCALA